MNNTLVFNPQKIITEKKHATCTILILGIAMNGFVGDLFENHTLL
jgi:hypothetical protein